MSGVSASAFGAVAGPSTAQLAFARQQFVTFRSGGQVYGVEITSVREIRSWQPTTTMPGRHAASRGALDIRGQIVEIFDLADLLGGGVFSPGSGSVVLVVADGERTSGLLVESVLDIIEVRDSDLLASPPTDIGSESTHVVERMVTHEDQLISILTITSLLP